MRMLTLTSPVETPWHRIPAPVKLALLAIWTAGLFWIGSPAFLLAAVVFIAILHAFGGKVFAAHALAMLRPLWPFVAVVAVWHVWTDDIRGGLVVILRMCAAVGAANLVTMTTRLDDMMAMVERLARPLAHIGLPPRSLALAMALVIRFIPVMTERHGQIADAWRARSAKSGSWRVLLPTVLAALDDADHVAEALRARGGSA
jgi:biotin transport system permease protein